MTIKIAWIEDEIWILQGIIDYLEEDGFTIEGFTSAQEAIDKIEMIKNCELILLDLIIPPGEGGESLSGEYLGLSLLKLFRNNYKINTPVIIFSTASAVKQFTKEVKDYDVSDILVKSILPSQLKRTILKALK